MSDESKPLSRRGLLAAAAGGTAVAALAVPSAADAAVGGAVLLGETTNDAVTNETWITSAPSGDKATVVLKNTTAVPPPNGVNLPDGLRVFAQGAGIGAAIQGFGGPGTFSGVQTPNQGVGVRGLGSFIGVQGRSVDASDADGVGVQGESALGIGVYGLAPTAVRGDGQGADSVGVSGSGEAFGVTGGTIATGAGTGVFGGAGTGVGVHGFASSLGGVGVRAEIDIPTDGTALDVVGPVAFSTAGLSTIASGQTKVTVNPGVPLTVSTKVLATLQSAGGTLKFVSRSLGAGTITIHLTAAASAQVTVAWFVIV
jgi:hypothetical protein